ncbi:MAG TPA: 30S ribosomal protein S20 [Candidatus Faecisoma merdavium]|nr:30S ribosomal protein S20 [Candidatus Faecisoma merdavium]
MANMKNAKKKIKVIAKQTVTNNNYTASMKTACKNVEKAVNAKDKTKANENLKIAIKRIDKAAQAGTIKKNNAARNKSRLTKKVNAME